MVVCLLLDPRFAVSSPAEGDGFIFRKRVRELNISEVKLSEVR
jgi:hypothetical protein